jgi:hypothetical protein
MWLVVVAQIKVREASATIARYASQRAAPRLPEAHHQDLSRQTLKAFKLSAFKLCITWKTLVFETVPEQRHNQKPHSTSKW